MRLDQLRESFIPKNLKHFAVMKEDVGKIFVVLHVSPTRVLHRIVSRQELVELERFVLSWYELSEFEVNFIPEHIKPL